MEYKFKYGDRVWAGKHPAKVTTIRKVDDKHYYTVKFDNIKLIPSEMEYEEGYLKLEYSQDKQCPICGKKYKVVKFNMRVWKDCENCKDTKENLEKQYAKNKYRELNTEERKEELLEEFEKMLNLDDDEYFFNFDRGVIDD